MNKNRLWEFFRSAPVAAVLLASVVSNGYGQTGKPISGAPRVMEGDLIQVGEKLVRLYAIDAPEMKQTCEGKSRKYACGVIAKTGLMDLTAGLQSISCQPTGKIQDGVIVAVCKDPQGFDLSQQMVYTGWALALPDAANLFHSLQQKAQEAKRGLWKGHVVRPWRWRPESEADK